MTELVEQAFIPPEKQNLVYQDVLYGIEITAVALKHNLTFEDVAQVVRDHAVHGTPARKTLALARLDLATKSLMPKLVAGDTQAIHTYLRIQEREAKLTGMEAATKQDTHITIDVPWLTKDRLAYKNEDGMVIQNVTDITPVLEVKKAWREGQEPDARKDHTE